MINHGTLAKIMANHDTWNACQDLARISWFRTLGVAKKRICYHGTLGKKMVNHGILAKIMVSLCTILHGHGILAKIMARSWQGYQGTCHGSWQVYHGFEHDNVLPYLSMKSDRICTYFICNHDRSKI